MAAARIIDFPDRIVKLAEFAKAISHPARIEILRALAARKECVCGELVLDLPLAQSTVSQHLKALKELGLIRGQTDGPRSRYCVNWKVFEKYQKQMGEWAEQMLAHRQENCC